MTATVFIDGEAGTTGLEIRERLSGRDDLHLARLPEAERKNPGARRRLLNTVDLAILCLPQAAAEEAVAMVENPSVRVIDASTAHRTAAGWVYGFPELAPGQAAAIRGATRVSNPGCYATGAIALLRPLVDAGLIPREHSVAINAVSGYSGGGKALIQRFEDAGSPTHAPTPFYLYGLDLAHKHVPEIRAWSGLARRPLFVPSVGRFAQGMLVSIPIDLESLPGHPSATALHGTLVARYAGAAFVTVAPLAATATMTELAPEALNGTNALRLYVFSDRGGGQALLVAQLDNLGKGASGAAVQNLNLMLGLEEMRGLST
jgi:N-acetyl-gamma-glutamyl-phosphate reductase